MNKLVLNMTMVGIFFFQISWAKVIDLTHSFDEKTIYWPTEKGFQRETLFFGETKKHFFYSAFKFCAPEHGGTHIDAPIHFSKKGLSVEQIPMQNLMGNAVVIDVSQRVNGHPDDFIRPKDIQSWEKKYRQLNADDIVLFRTDWSRYWGNKKKYLGSDILGDVSHLHFPGLSKKAASFLVTRGVKGLGIDTPSMDRGKSTNFPAHQIILGANKYGLENLDNLKKLPPVGAKLIIAPMKIKGGSGAPTRVFAIIEQKA